MKTIGASLKETQRKHRGGNTGDGSGGNTGDGSVCLYACDIIILHQINSYILNYLHHLLNREYGTYYLQRNTHETVLLCECSIIIKIPMDFCIRRCFLYCWDLCVYRFKVGGLNSPQNLFYNSTIINYVPHFDYTLLYNTIDRLYFVRLAFKEDFYEAYKTFKGAGIIIGLRYDFHNVAVNGLRTR